MIPRAGQYETCVMLVNLQRAVPDVCEQDVAEDQSTWPMGHPMCPHHIRRMEDWAHRRHVDLTEQAREQRIEVLVREREERDAARVVYFARRADGHIKIGFTGSVSDRMGALRREHGPLELLATIPGGPDVERAHHETFHAERLGSSEWFLPSERLLAYIERLADGDQELAS